MNVVTGYAVGMCNMVKCVPVSEVASTVKFVIRKEIRRVITLQKSLYLFLEIEQWDIECLLRDTTWYII